MIGNSCGKSWAEVGSCRSGESIINACVRILLVFPGVLQTEHGQGYANLTSRAMGMEW